MRTRSLLTRLAVLAAAVTGVSGALASPAMAAPLSAVPNGRVVVQNLEHGGCLSAPDGGGRVTLGPCSSVWDITAAPDSGAQLIRRAGTTECLTVSPILIYPPLVVTQGCENPWSHRWDIREAAPGIVQIRSADQPSACLTAPDPGTVTVLPCGQTDGQDWRLQRVY